METLSRDFTVDSNLTRMTGILNEDMHTFMTISRLVLPTMRNILDKLVEKNPTTDVIFSNNVFFFENSAVYMGKKHKNVLLRFHCNTGYANALQCHFVRTMSCWF